MDPQRGLCLGCARSLEEIARWSAMTDPEREKIIAELPARRAALNVPEVSVPPLA